MMTPVELLPLAVAVALYVFIFGILPVIEPYLTAISAAGVAAVGRFVWNNHKRSKQNRVRLDRYGRALFGDDNDDADLGVTVQLKRLSEQVEDVEGQLDNLDRKIDELSAN